MRSNEEIITQIKELIETNIKPAVAGHGGVVNFVDYQDGALTLEMSGACSGCAGSMATLQQGIEGMMKHYVPEVKEVKPIDA